MSEAGNRLIWEGRAACFSGSFLVMRARTIRAGPSLAFLGGSAPFRAMAPIGPWGLGALADLGTLGVNSRGREWDGGMVDVRYEGLWRYGVEGIMAASESPGFGILSGWATGR